jgi:hypothetical protein
MVRRIGHSSTPGFDLVLRLVATVLCSGAGSLLAQASQPVEAGFRDFNFGTTVSATPTGEKPESKLWWNDGSWWGSLWSDADLKYHLLRLDVPAQSWIDTGTALDDRRNSKADALWDQAQGKLYLASHVFSTNAVPQTGSSQWGRLYRYSYDAGLKSYSVDAGFPVTITQGNAESLTVARDSSGRLWATWVESGKVMVNRSITNDLDWGAPLVLPVSAEAASVTTDDLSTIIAFGGDQVGVLWSNTATQRFYFSTHRDGDAHSDWQREEAVLPDGNCPGACVDDHLSLKTDATGRVYAAVKTSLNDLTDPDPDAPLILLLVREPSGTWSSHVFGRVQDKHTRPIVLLDEENSDVYLFATRPETGESIYYKRSALSPISFEPGLGTPFIKSSSDTTINNATSTKQNLNPATGLLVLASDQNTRFYFHNFLRLQSQKPAITSFSPTSGPVGTGVTITGSGFTGAVDVAFNGTPASFEVGSSTQISTRVPNGATTGKISVTNAAGTAVSDGVFRVTHPPVISSFTPNRGLVGTPVSINGSRFTGVTEVAFNGVPARSFVLINDTWIVAVVPLGATTGKIGVTTPEGTGFSASNFTVGL